MEQILRELTDNTNIRANLSSLRQKIKESENKSKALAHVEQNEAMYLGFLQSEDAKTRKNAALLFGDFAYQDALEALFEAYTEAFTENMIKTIRYTIPNGVYNGSILLAYHLLRKKRFSQLSSLSKA